VRLFEIGWPACRRTSSPRPRLQKTILSEGDEVADAGGPAGAASASGLQRSVPDQAAGGLGFRMFESKPAGAKRPGRCEITMPTRQMPPR
jgi:hypothetical protein